MPYQRPKIDRAALHKQLDDIIDIAERFDPLTCEDPVRQSVGGREPPFDVPAERPLFGRVPDEVWSGPTMTVTEVMRGKDNAALAALLVLEQIAKSVVGWAIMHETSRAVNKHISIDDHRHETDDFEWRAEDRRKAICRLASFLPWPAVLQAELKEALEALDFGEVQPLLQPNETKGRGLAYSLFKERLIAVKLVRYKAASGMQKGISRQHIARSYGTSEHTVRSWEEKYLPNIMGQDEFSREMEDAERAGRTRLSQERDNDFWKNGVIDGYSLMMADILDNQWERRREIGECYRDLLRNYKEKE